MDWPAGAINDTYMIGHGLIEETLARGFCVNKWAQHLLTHLLNVRPLPLCLSFAQGRIRFG